MKNGKERCPKHRLVVKGGSSEDPVRILKVTNIIRFQLQVELVVITTEHLSMPMYAEGSPLKMAGELGV